MWIASLLFVLTLWLLLTGLCLWWMFSLESGRARIGWGLCIFLLPGMGAMLWLAYGRRNRPRLRIDSGQTES